MNEKKNKGENGNDSRSLIDIVRRLLKREGVDEIPAIPAGTTVENLIERAGAMGRDMPEGNGKPGGEDKPDEEGEPEGKESCPYATRRAIVESLAEIRRFAEEHKLATTVVKALLTLLAEIAIGALRGKVSGKVLDLLLKALHYDSDRLEAYAEGERAGRNAKISMEIFPAQDQELPDINGALVSPPAPASIFDIARDAN